MPENAPIPEDRSLEADPAVMREWLDRAGSAIIEHILTLPEQHAGYDQSRPRRKIQPAPLPEKGIAFTDALDRVMAAVTPSFNTAGPGYLAYIPGGGLFESALAEFIAGALNRYVGVGQAAPGFVAIEAEALRWLADIVGYPSGARGILTSGGSLANFSAVVAARVDRLGEDLDQGVVYTGDQVHHSVAKAARLAGIREKNVFAAPSDERFRVRLDAIERAIDRDLAAGKRPFMLVCSAGTTNTGAVDDLRAAAELARRKNLWLHVDAAYGGFFNLTDYGRKKLRGIELADSVTLDPHKGMFLPYGTGALLCRDGEKLRRAHALEAAYLPPSVADPHDPLALDFAEYSPELSRNFRGLSVWLPFMLHGAGVFRRNLDEKLALARLAADRLREVPDVEIVAEPELSITAFRLSPPGMPIEESNALNRRWLNAVLDRGRIWITSTMIAGRFVIRIAVLSFRTHRDRVEEGLRILAETRATLG